MTIEENLAMAERRGKRRGLGIAVTEAGRARYRAALAPIGLGLEIAARRPRRHAVGRPAPGAGAADGDDFGSRLLLLDEHLAALDPKTAESVMDLTARLVSEQRLTTLMITHNMQDAIRWGNRLLMMHAGRIVFDVSGAAKAALTVPALVDKFHEVESGRPGGGPYPPGALKKLVAIGGDVRRLEGEDFMTVSARPSRRG